MNNKPERRKAISDFAKSLCELAKSAPDGYARRDINRTVHALRQRYKVSPEEMKVEILSIVESGAKQFSDLLDETGFTRHQLEHGLKELQSDKKIEIRKVKLSGNRRLVTFYFSI